MKAIKYAQVERHITTMKGEGSCCACRDWQGRRRGQFLHEVFEISSGGNPKHAHDWEHEMFIHQGKGEVYGTGNGTVSRPGMSCLSQHEEHQIRIQP